MGNLTMSTKEREQLVVFEELKNGQITQLEAANRLKVTPRWIRKKLGRFKNEGASGLVHKGRGKPSRRRWDPAQEALALDLLRGNWQGFRPTIAAEKLEELHGIKVSKETLRQAMIRAGLWQGKKARVVHRKRRERSPMFGMLVQLDGSPHDWLEGRGQQCTLLVFIDDATSRLLWIEFVHSESKHAVMTATKNYIQKCGRPIAFYVDFGVVFSVNRNNSNRTKKTEWKRGCEALSIEVKHAHSPQAKGRVERANGVLQDRLVKELRLAGISTIDGANQFLATSKFLDNHNARFAVAAAQSGDAHRPTLGYDLNAILCFKSTRVVANDFVVQFKRRIFQISQTQDIIVRPKDRVLVSELLDGAILLSARDVALSFIELKGRSHKLSPEETCITQKSYYSGESEYAQTVKLPLEQRDFDAKRREVRAG